ncbi:hypothetical protein niasHS_016613 [Heterodera schachtii]|uniref:pectate lyase n=1 Tax=Heterodera schachtii TaxID=97005 RepID=A0ABD2HRC7_HETSC
MTVAFYPMMKMKTKKIIAKNPTNVLVQIQGESKADNIGKLGRGCGTHNQQCKRKFVFENIKVTGVKSTLCGINQNMETWRSSKMCRSVAVQQTCAACTIELRSATSKSEKQAMGNIVSFRAPQAANGMSDRRE